MINANTDLRNVCDTLFYMYLRKQLSNVALTVVVTNKSKLVPSTGKAIHNAFINARNNPDKPFYVLATDRNTPCFFTHLTNDMYRTVHDIDHAVAYEFGRGTTKSEDEKYLNCGLAYRAMSYVLSQTNRDISEAYALFMCIYHDTVGQVSYYVDNQEFVTDQLAFTMQLVNDCPVIKNIRAGRLSLARQQIQSILVNCGVL